MSEAASLQGPIASLFPTEVAVSVLSLAAAEASLLLEGEEAALGYAAPVRRREYSVGRAAARSALASLGAPPVAIGRDWMGAPVWPSGHVGSITHGAGLACAVVAKESAVAALGVDAETAGALEAQLVDLVCRPDERAHMAELPRSSLVDWPKLVFGIKEAIYKCAYPLTRSFVDFLDVSVRIRTGASSRDGSCSVAYARADVASAVSAMECRWAVRNEKILCGAWLLPRRN